MRKLNLLLASLSFLLFEKNLTAQCWQQAEIGNGSLWAIRNDGTLWMGGITGRNDTWTSSGSTTLSAGESFKGAFPIQVGNDNKWKKIISTSDGSQYAIKTDGTIWAWGNNGNNELGLGNVNQHVPNPTQIGTDNNWKQISAGRKYAMAIKQDGSLWGWGYNLTYQFGNNTQVSSNTPIRIGTNNDWKFISCGSSSTIAIKTNGTLWRWGGITWQFPIPTPEQIGVDNDWKMVDFAAGASTHALLLKNNNTLWGIGWNSLCKQLTSNYNMILYNLPVQIGTANDWLSIKANYSSSYAIKQNGSLWQWGWNRTGSSCDGTNFIANPTQISLNSVSTFSTSGYNSFAAIQSNGTLNIWGQDSYTSQTLSTKAQPTAIGSQVCPCLCSGDDKFLDGIKVSSQGKTIDSVACNKPLTIKLSCGVNYNFYAPAFTNTTVCAAKDSLVIRSSTGIVVTPAPKATINAPFVVTFSQPGTYNLVYLITRGGRMCKECSVTVTVDCVKRVTNEAIKTDAKKMIEIKQ